MAQREAEESKFKLGSVVSLIIGSSEREAAAYFCLLKLVQGFLLVNSNLEPLNNGDYRCCLIKFKTEKCNAIATQ